MAKDEGLMEKWVTSQMRLMHLIFKVWIKNCMKQGDAGGFQ